MTPEIEAAVRLGKQIAERAAQYACHQGVLAGILALNLNGYMSFIQDPEKFINDLNETCWQALTQKSWSQLSGAEHELDYYS